jgi:amino acid adenylation domain-containing protein
MQRAMLADALLHPGRGNDIEQVVLSLPEAIDARVLRSAWAAALARHDALRLTFTWTGDEPVQGVRPVAEPVWAELDWSDTSGAAADARLDQWLREDRRRGFDLGNGTPQRHTLIRRGPADFVLVWTFHHLLLDGRAIPVVLQEVFEGPTAGPVDAPSFVRYARAVAAADLTRAESYWRAQLAAREDTAPLVVHDPPPLPPDPQDDPFGEVVLSCPPPLRAALAERATAWGITLNTLIQGAWALLLSRGSGTEESCFGAIVGDRRWAGAQADQLVGNFIHVVPVRIACPTAQTVRDWLVRLRAQQVAQRDVPPVGLPQLAEWAGRPRGARLFDTLLLFENRPWDETLRARGGAWAQRGLALREQTGWPLTLAVYARAGLELRLEFERARYAPAAATMLLETVAHLLDALARVPAETPLHALGLLPRSEQLPRATGIELLRAPPPRNVLELVAEQVARQPDAPAITAGDHTLTYAEWSRRAQALAGRLQQAGVQRGDLVAVRLPRGPAFAIAVLAVLRAGGAYVPLDEDDPPARQAMLLADCGARVGLCSSEATEESAIRWLHISDAAASPLPGPVTANPGPHEPAYVLYTSGSTGRPKGVPITHSNLAHFIDSVRTLYALASTDRVLQFCALTFDSSVEEHWMTWCTGAHLIARPPGPPPSVRDLLAFVARERITVLDLPTAYWRVWMAMLEEASLPVPPSLRMIIVGGEEARADDYARLRRWCGPAVRWLNTYGPTECTVVATAYEPGPDHPAAAAGGGVPIGFALPHLTARVVDRAGHVLPVGLPGELVLGGAGVATGYLNRPEETAARFVADPFGPAGACCYRTGDRVWQRRDGALVFAGRLDQQVKWRGYRIEPGEIEAALAAHPAVQEVVVTLVDPPDAPAQLAAFWTSRPGATADEAALRAQVAARLPAHFVPGAFVQLEQLPLTASGKLDRRALPLDRIAARAAADFDPPVTPQERKLAALWQEALGVKQVGRQDNFFALGGHSLTALSLLQRAQSAGVSLDAATLFRAPTLADLARSLEPKAPTDSASATAPWLVTLRPGPDTVPPLVLLPSDFGDLLIYANLVPLLDPGRACLGLQCPELYRDDQGIRSMADLAERFVQALRAVQPHGPYLLAGHCYGGYVAMEMAKQLAAAGERIGLLALLDARPCAPVAERGQLWLMYLRSALRAGGADWLRHLRARVDQRLQARRLDRLIRRDPGQLDPRLRNRWLLDQRTLVGYRSTLYDDRLTYIYPAGSRHELYDDPSCGWLHLAARLDLHRVPGTHLDMMKEPHVRELAACLQSCIVRAEETRGAAS